MENKTKVLITGGFGFVGSSIVNKLLKKKNLKYSLLITYLELVLRIIIIY
jgi:nucleoside-diphosphate-sugar epimerase